MASRTSAERKWWCVVVVLGAATSGCHGAATSTAAHGSPDGNAPAPPTAAPAAVENQTDGDAQPTEHAMNYETATLGAGCFWCVEAVFQQLDGVIQVQSGYSGGTVPHPTYRQVCSGETGHAEVCQITFDPGRLSFSELLEVFWKSHDPTTLNRQGADEGTQYRSVVFCHTDQQQQLAESYKQKLDAVGAFAAPIVTAVEPFTVFYPAEEYHRDYFNRNPNEGYCRVVIAPKVAKFRQVFSDKLKKTP